MVSRANVPRKMTSATRLTEAEKIELEWESLWERIGASFCKIQREQEAKLDKVLRSLQDLRSTMEARDASSGKCKSQVELPKFSDNLDFQKLIDVDRAIADEDLMEQHSSGGYEEIDTELKIGVEDCARVSKEIEDIQFLEVTVTPLQKTEEMEIFTSLPHNRKSTEVKKGRELEQDKLKGTERLSHARQNALVSELTVGLPISACYSLSLSWLLNWFSRPMVKLKFVAQCDDELYEGFDGRRNGFLGCGGFSISEDREHLGIEGENGYALVEMQPDQRSGDTRYSAGVFDGVYSVSYFGGNVLGDSSYPLGSVVPGVSMVSRKGPCSKRKSSPASIFTLLKEIGGLGHVHMGEKAVALVDMDVIMVPFAMKVNFLLV